jgi:hypothetical protein
MTILDLIQSTSFEHLVNEMAASFLRSSLKLPPFFRGKEAECENGRQFHVTIPEGEWFQSYGSVRKGLEINYISRKGRCWSESLK